MDDAPTLLYGIAACLGGGNTGQPHGRILPRNPKAAAAHGNEMSHECGLYLQGIVACPECEAGSLVLDPVSAPRWRLDCNRCRCSYS